MAKDKITVVGAGNVGATTAFIAATRRLGEIVLVDIVKGLAEGKALDMAEASPLELSQQEIVGTTDWAATVGSDVVIITSGIPRKPGMSRDDLLATNAKIVREVSSRVVEHSPNAIVIVVCNPLDAMVHVAAQVTGFAKQRVMGMAGALDAARFRYFLAAELGVSVADVQCVLMGGHGDDMVPLPRFTTVSGVPIRQLLPQARMDQLVDRTRKGGIEIVNLLGFSAFTRPPPAPCRWRRPSSGIRRASSAAARTATGSMKPAATSSVSRQFSAGAGSRRLSSSTWMDRKRHSSASPSATSKSWRQE